MKKIILSAILLTGSIVLANAQITEQAQTPATEQAAPEAGYKTVTAAELPSAVQEAVKNLACEACDVKSVEFDAAKELTKVTLVNKADQREKSVILDKEGKEVAA